MQYAMAMCPSIAFIHLFIVQLAALIAFLTANWRVYLVTLNVLCLPAVVLILLWRESPRWLIQRGNLAAAAQELNDINRRNKCKAHFQAEDLSRIQTSCKRGEGPRLQSNKQIRHVIAFHSIHAPQECIPFGICSAPPNSLFIRWS